MMRPLVPIVAVLVAFCAVLLPAGAAAALRAVHLREGAEVQALAVGAEGDLWVAGVATDSGATTDFVGWISPAEEVKTYSVESEPATAGIGGLAGGPEGDMWFTLPGTDAVANLDTAGELSTFGLHPGSRPTGLAVTSAGFVWAAQEGDGRITALDPGHTELFEWNLDFSLPAPGIKPTAMVLGTDHHLWALQAESANLTRMSLRGSPTTIPEAAGSAKFGATVNSDIAAGTDGSIWVSQSDAPTVGKAVASSGDAGYTRYRVPGNSGTTLISAGPDGDIWFADAAGKIGSIAPDGRTGELTCAVNGCLSGVQALTRGPEGRLWFAAGTTIAPFAPPPLTLKLDSRSGKVRNMRAAVLAKCSGGAAGQVCGGRIVLLGSDGSGGVLARGRCHGVTGSTSEVDLNLTHRGADLLAARPSLRTRVAIMVAGRQASGPNFTLRAAG